jgi:hypothetical protein
MQWCRGVVWCCAGQRSPCGGVERVVSHRVCLGLWDNSHHPVFLVKLGSPNVRCHQQLRSCHCRSQFSTLPDTVRHGHASGWYTASTVTPSDTVYPTQSRRQSLNSYCLGLSCTVRSFRGCSEWRVAISGVVSMLSWCMCYDMTYMYVVCVMKFNMIVTILLCVILVAL